MKIVCTLSLIPMALAATDATECFIVVSRCGDVISVIGIRVKNAREKLWELMRKLVFVARKVICFQITRAETMGLCEFVMAAKKKFQLVTS